MLEVVLKKKKEAEKEIGNMEVKVERVQYLNGEDTGAMFRTR